MGTATAARAAGGVPSGQRVCTVDVINALLMRGGNTEEHRRAQK
jgi:hypothetical protein